MSHTVAGGPSTIEQRTAQASRIPLGIRNHFLLIVAIASAIGLGLYRLGEASLWLDEAASYYLARLRWSLLFEMIAESKANMSLYFVSLRLWAPVGDDEAAIRSLSLVFAALCLPVVYFVAVRLLRDRTLAGLTALLLATNAYFLEFAQEARGYSLAMLLACLATLALLRAEEHRRPFDWVVYAVVAAAGLYAHFFVALVLLAHVASHVARGRSAPWKALLASLGLVAVLAAPLAVFVRRNTAETLLWLDQPTLLDAWLAFQDLAGGYLVIGLVMLVSVAAGTVVAIRAHPSRRTILLLMWAFGPLVLSFALSFWKPIFLARYLIISLPALCVLAVLGLSAIRPRPLLAAVTIAIIGLNLYGFVEYTDQFGPIARSQARLILRQARPGDGILFLPPHGRIPLDYYLGRSPRVDDAPVPIYPSRAWSTNPYRERLVGDARPPPTLDPCAHERIWLVGRAAGSRELATLLTDQLAAWYEPVQRKGPGLGIQLYRARATACQVAAG